MPDWTNYPSGNAIPTIPWPNHIAAQFDRLNPPPKPFDEYTTSQVWGPFEMLVAGDDPEPWQLDGNFQVGTLDWNVWTRTYPSLTVRMYILLGIEYFLHTGQLAGLAITRPVHTERFYFPQGPPRTFRDATVWYPKPASKSVDGEYAAVRLGGPLGQGDPKSPVDLGGVSLDGLDQDLVPGEGYQVDTTPPNDPEPPAGSKRGDPAEELLGRAGSVRRVREGLLASFEIEAIDHATGERVDGATVRLDGVEAGTLRAGGPTRVAALITPPPAISRRRGGGHYGQPVRVGIEELLDGVDETVRASMAEHGIDSIDELSVVDPEAVEVERVNGESLREWRGMARVLTRYEELEPADARFLIRGLNAGSGDELPGG